MVLCEQSWLIIINQQSTYIEILSVRGNITKTHLSGTSFYLFTICGKILSKLLIILWISKTLWNLIFKTSHILFSISGYPWIFSPASVCEWVQTDSFRLIIKTIADDDSDSNADGDDKTCRKWSWLVGGWWVSVITRGVVAPYGELSGPISDYQCHLSFEVVMLVVINIIMVILILILITTVIIVIWRAISD